MTITIRPFNFDKLNDYAAMEAVERDVYPDEFETAAEHQHMDKSHGEHFVRRFLAEDNGLAVGWAHVKKVWWYEEPNQYSINGSVLKARQGSGVGKQLNQALQEAVASRTVESQITWVREDKTRAVHFLEARGFKQKMRDAMSELDVTAFNASRFAGAVEKVSAQNIKLYDLVELAKVEPAWKQKIWEMRWPIRRDIPTSETKKQISYEVWHKVTIESPTYDPAGYVVAIAPSGEYIGYSQIETSEADPTKLYTGVTGVKRDWRRKGVATALKLAIIDYAKATGVTRIVTENEESNPMYALNMALGFRPIPGWLTMKRVNSNE